MSFNYKFLKRKHYYKYFSIDNLKKSETEKLRVWRNSQRKVLRQNKILTKSEQKNYFNKYIKNQTKKNGQKLFYLLIDIKMKLLVTVGSFIYRGKIKELNFLSYWIQSTLIIKKLLNFTQIIF